MNSTANITCSEAQKLMSPYIDSMVEREEADRLDSHLETCESCHRELQSFVSLRNLMAGVEPVRPPRDLALETRIRLSHARSDGPGGWVGRMVALETLLVNVLKPLAIPAASGIALTVLSFSMLFGYIGVSFHREAPVSAMASAEPVRITEHTIFDVPAIAAGDWKEPVSVQLSVGFNGKTTGITILSGSRSPETKRALTNGLYSAQFIPATMFGKPVNSTTILTFVNVRS